MPVLSFFNYVIIGALILFWKNYSNAYLKTGEWDFRRKRSALMWAICGGLIGSFFGVAGFGGAIPGTVPGAIVGYLLASNLMRRDFTGSDIPLDYKIYSERYIPQNKQDVLVEEAPISQKKVPEGEISSDYTGWVIFPLFIVILVAIVWLTRPTPRPEESTQSDPASLTSSRHQSKTKENNKTVYEREFARLAREYPRLNKNSRYYDQSIVDKVNDRVAEYASKGLAPEAAIIYAESDLLYKPKKSVVRRKEAHQPAAVEDNLEPSIKRLAECEYKSVMTNDDYKACGIQPPR